MTSSSPNTRLGRALLPSPQFTPSTPRCQARSLPTESAGEPRDTRVYSPASLTGTSRRADTMSSALAMVLMVGMAVPGRWDIPSITSMAASTPPASASGRSPPAWTAALPPRSGGLRSIRLVGLMEVLCPAFAEFPKNPHGSVNLQPGVYVYKMFAAESLRSDDKISAPGGRSRGHDDTRSRKYL